MKHLGFKSAALALAMVASASAFTVSGKVVDENGKAIEKASVELLKNGLKTMTDSKGEFKLSKIEIGGDSVGQNPNDSSISIHPVRSMLGYVSVVNGILSYSQSTNHPVRVQVFDAVGSRILNETVYGSGTLDMQSIVKARGSYFARVSVGSAVSNFRFTSSGNYKASFGEAVARGLAKEGVGDELRVIASDFDTLKVNLDNLDTNVTLKLKKTVKEPEFAFGWAKKNAPVPTRGCGKDAPSINFGDRGNNKKYWEFKWSKGTRTVRIDIPDNYDKNKPYRLVFGMQCMGGWAGGVQDEGYYGLKPLDTEKTTIFVAPEGNGGFAPWGQDDYILFDELLAFLEGNYCIDSSRVFSAGFSYGSMFTNGLSWNHQEVIRGVAVYETADVNIWLPEKKKLPIAWMGVLGLQDDLCVPSMGRSARDRILADNGINGNDPRQEKAEEYSGNGPHVCYNYKTVDPRFPVRWCTQNGGHIWNHSDGWGQPTWVPESTWEFFTQF